jgi:hypothetical protein
VAKYDPLFKLLCEAGNEPVELSFDEIERVVGALPVSARKYSAWWANESAGTQHVQAVAWVNAGREVVSVDRDRERVIFSAASWRRGA